MKWKNSSTCDQPLLPGEKVELEVLHRFSVQHVRLKERSWVMLRKGNQDIKERSEILLKKYRELLIRAKKIGEKVCVSGILPRLS